MAGAVDFVRGMNRRAGSVILEELWPGEEIDGRDDVRRQVQDEALGPPRVLHLQDGTDGRPLGRRRQRVPGTRSVDRLRIVDASVFPRIPGFFVAAPIYMISEKASDVILASAQGATAEGVPR